MQYSSNCLKMYNGRFHETVVRLYIHHISMAMGANMVENSNALNIFVEDCERPA
jgi:hypothetical protein